MIKHKFDIITSVRLIFNKMHTLIVLMPTCNIQKIVQYTLLLLVQKKFESKINHKLL